MVDVALWTFLALVLLSGTASAHIAMTSPAPRTAEQKTGPCGEAGGKRGTKVTRFAPGATITVEWDETVDHPGHFRIAFDNDGDDAFINATTSIARPATSVALATVTSKSVLIVLSP